MKLEQQQLINMEWSSNKNYWSTGNEQYLLINREWSYNNTYWSTRNEVRTTTTDQQGMKLER